MAKKSRTSTDKDLLVRIRRRFTAMTEHDRTNRQLAIDDLRFLNLPGEQWDLTQKTQRGMRPCYEFNKLRVTAKRVINDMRANRPQGKVRAVEDGDKDTADVLEGLIRNIWNVSDADTVIDYAAEYQVGGGMGAWRVNTQYSSDTVFDQDIVIEPIKNPFCLYADPAASDPIKRDAKDWILTEKISKASFDERWPDAKPVNFDDTEFDDDDDWFVEESDDDGMVRICEYWYQEPTQKTLLMLSDGSTVDAISITPEELKLRQLTIQKSRTIDCHKIMMCIASGDALLEKPVEWAGSHFPFIQIYGEWLVIDGKVYWHGLTRFAKDAQRSYNVARTAISETISMAPQSKFWATPEQALGHTDKWAEAHSKLFPFLLYNSDPKAPGPPLRMGGAEVPIALMQESQLASDEIKAVTGIFDNSLGQQANESSGVAITARQRQGEIATFNYSDNMAKGIRRTYEILIDLVPKIYDSARSVRVLGVDLSEKYQKINMPVQGPDGQIQVENDLSRGKYDVTVTVGPSFSTQRQEATELYTQLGQAVPQLWQVAGDLIMKSMDLPYSDQMAERMKLLLPPQIQQQMADGKQMPPEVQQAMNQANQAMQAVQQHGQLVQQAEQELKDLQAQVKGDQANSKLAQAALAAKEAQLEQRFGELALAQKELELASARFDMARTLLAKDEQIAALKIKSAHQDAAHMLESTATGVEHDLNNQMRDLNQSATEAHHGLEMQSMQADMSNMQAAHKQDMKSAKTPKPSA
jgi:hypothetical protein